MIFVNLAEKYIRFQAYIDYAKERVDCIAPIGIGKPETPTPQGRFAIRHKIAYPESMYPAEHDPEKYGAVILELNISGYPKGGGELCGYCIHGTDDEPNIGAAHTRGCVTMKKDALIYLFNHVEKGHEVVIWNGVPDFDNVPDWRRIKMWPPLKGTVSYRRNHVSL